MEHVKQFYKNKRVLVTGGAGFIGSHIVEALIEAQAHVTILDNFSSGSISNLRSVVGNITVLYSDIRSLHSCIKATENKDVVFHCAAQISVPQSIQDPTGCYAINIDGTHNILEACKKTGVSSFVFSTSASVYGNREGICHETDTPAPCSPYAISKLKGEELCKQYALEASMNIGCLRYFNVYGPRQNPHGAYAAVVTKFTHQLQNHEPLTVFGDGNQTRDFIHVANVAQANLHVGSLQGLTGEIFNIATGTSISLLTLINNLEAQLAIKSVGLIHQAPRQGDILHSLASVQKYRNLVAKS